MGNTAVFESREVKLNKEIEDQLGTLAAASPLKLPGADAEASRLYVQKIEGTYNIDRAKKCTDNVIDLLYIAYNTTPQTEGEARVQSSEIMGRLIKAQQESEREMRGAVRVADSVVRSLGNTFPDWLDVRECKGSEDAEGVAKIMDFIKSDLLKLAKEIKEKALGVKSKLDGIAIYDDIIKDTVAAASKSETALVNRLKDKAKLEKELVELGKDLQSEVAFFVKSFADFMHQVSAETGLDIELVDKFVGRDTVLKNAFDNLVLSTDKFFLRQAAEWNTITFVLDKLVKSIADGWSKMNNLSGKYITGNELKAYLETASQKLDEIVAERELASKQQDLGG
jgi:hypothetical protein